MAGQSEITFSIWKMFVRNEQRGEIWILPTREYFVKGLKEFKKINSKFHTITKIDGDNFIFIIIDSGDIEPRDEFVIDVESAEKRANPRNKNEVELIKQTFIYYDFETDLLYISGVRHKGLFEKVLDLKSDEDILIKGVYEDSETFLKLIKSVEEISFKTEDDIFASLSDKRQTLYDLFETSDLGDLTLDLKLKNIPKQKIINFIKSLFAEQKNQTLTSLMIRGKDESNFEYVYNINSFIKKLTMVVDKQTSGKFENEDVLKALKQSILEMSNAKINQKG